MKPNNNSNLGLTGHALILKTINKGAFMHTYSQAQNFPYQEMVVGRRLLIKPNLSTVPQTYGLYLQDTYVCDVGSPLQKKFMELYITEPPLFPIDPVDYDREFHEEMMNSYLNYLQTITLNQELEGEYGLKILDKETTQSMILSAMKMGYLPTELNRKDENGRELLISSDTINLKEDFPNLDITDLEVYFFWGMTAVNLDLYLQTYPKLKELGLLP